MPSAPPNPLLHTLKEKNHTLGYHTPLCSLHLVYLSRLHTPLPPSVALVCCFPPLSGPMGRSFLASLILPVIFFTVACCNAPSLPTQHTLLHTVAPTYHLYRLHHVPHYHTHTRCAVARIDGTLSSYSADHTLFFHCVVLCVLYTYNCTDAHPRLSFFLFSFSTLVSSCLLPASSISSSSLFLNVFHRGFLFRQLGGKGCSLFPSSYFPISYLLFLFPCPYNNIFLLFYYIYPWRGLA